VCIYRRIRKNPIILALDHSTREIRGRVFSAKNLAVFLKHSPDPLLTLSIIETLHINRLHKDGLVITCRQSARHAIMQAPRSSSPASHIEARDRKGGGDGGTKQERGRGDDVDVAGGSTLGLTVGASTTKMPCSAQSSIFLWADIRFKAEDLELGWREWQGNGGFSVEQRAHFKEELRIAGEKMVAKRFWLPGDLGSEPFQGS
jgi:hypothetical protein